MRTRSLVAVAAIAALVAALFATFGPTYESCGQAAGATTMVCRRESTVAANGWWILIVVAIPVVVALVPLAFDRRPVRVVSAVLLWAFTVITGFSIGLFFLPAALVMTIAAVRSEPAPTAA